MSSISPIEPGQLIDLIFLGEEKYTGRLNALEEKMPGMKMELEAFLETILNAVAPTDNPPNIRDVSILLLKLMQLSEFSGSIEPAAISHANTLLQRYLAAMGPNFRINKDNWRPLCIISVVTSDKVLNDHTMGLAEVVRFFRSFATEKTDKAWVEALPEFEGTFIATLNYNLGGHGDPIARPGPNTKLATEVARLLPKKRAQQELQQQQQQEQTEQQRLHTNQEMVVNELTDKLTERNKEVKLHKEADGKKSANVPTANTTTKTTFTSSPPLQTTTTAAQSTKQRRRSSEMFSSLYNYMAGSSGKERPPLKNPKERRGTPKRTNTNTNTRNKGGGGPSTP